MKRIFILSVSAAVLMMAAAGCVKDENAAAPVLTPAVETVQAPAAGDEFEVAYRIENPVDGAELRPVSNEDWITGCTVSDGVLGFEVLANMVDGEITEEREGKVTVVYSYASGAASFSVNVVQAGSNQTPELVISSDDEVMNVRSNAFRHTVHYALTGRVDGGEFRAYSDVDWIMEPDTQAADSVNFIVNVNTSDQAREGRLYLEYSWPDGKRTESVLVVQESGHIVYDAPMIDGFYYGKTVDPNNNQYFFYFTDNGFDEFGYAYPNSVYINIDLRVDDNPNLYELGIPAGTYEFTNRTDNMPSGSFTTQNGYIVNGDPYVLDMTGFSSGTLTVTRDGLYHEMTLDAVLADGRPLHASYSGEVNLSNSSGELPGFSGDVELTPTECYASMYEALGGGKRPSGGYAVWLYFDDSKIKSDGTKGDDILIYAFLDTDEYYRLIAPTGSMPVTEDMAASDGTVLGGFTATYVGSSPAGTYVSRYDEQGRAYYKFVTGGSMTMSRDENCFYTFEWSFTDENGDEITGSYTGPVRMTGRPGALSTATGDFSMDLSGITTGKAVRGGGSMKRSSAGNWQIELLPEFGKPADGMTIEICTGVNSDDPGTIAGTYKADITGAAGTFVIGQWWVTGHGSIRIDGMEGTGYVGDFSSDGLASKIVPAIDGEIVISENPDGTFTIEMNDLIDDHEPAFRFGGSWTGNLEFVRGSDDDNEWTVHSVPAPSARPSSRCIGYGEEWRF